MARKQSIAVLNLVNGTEFKLIIRPLAHELDFFDNCYVTGMVPNVRIHYFEQVHKEQGQFSYRTYNVFDLHSDFWQCLKTFKKNLPLSKKKVMMVKEKTSIMRNLMFGVNSLRANTMTSKELSQLTAIALQDPKAHQDLQPETEAPTIKLKQDEKPDF